MNNSEQEKYLEDFINSSGTVRNTVEEKKNKGYAIVAEAMFLNSTLFNSEAWHSLSEKEIIMLEAVDEHLLRSLVKGH